MQNRLKSFLPKSKREQLNSDEYIFNIIWDTKSEGEIENPDYYMITDKALYKKRKSEYVELSLSKIIGVTTVTGYINQEYSFQVISSDGKLDFVSYRKSNISPFQKKLTKIINDYQNHRLEKNIWLIKKALKNPENNYYVCLNCGKKVAQNDIQRRNGCKSCKKYDYDELQAGMKIIEKEKGTIDYDDLSEYAELNNLKIEQMWEKRDPILMKWLGSKQIDTFAELLEYIEEIKLQNRLDQYKQDWDKKIPGTERFDLFYEYQNHMEKVRKNSISRHLDMTNSYDEIKSIDRDKFTKELEDIGKTADHITDLLLFLFPTLGLLLLFYWFFNMVWPAIK